MNILQEFNIKDKKYVCTQKVLIDDKMLYICKDLNSNKRIYFKENKNGNIEEELDERIKNKINKLIYAKSEDVSD